MTTEDKTKSAAAGKQGRPSSSRPARNDTPKAAGTAGRRPAPRGQAKKPQNAQPPAGQPEKAAPPANRGQQPARAASAPRGHRGRPKKNPVLPVRLTMLGGLNEIMREENSCERRHSGGKELRQ